MKAIGVQGTGPEAVGTGRTLLPAATGRATGSWYAAVVAPAWSARRTRALTAAELSAYDHLPTDLARRARVVRSPWVPGRFVGITIGRFVIVHGHQANDGSSVLLAHELVHVRQWAELGVVGFLARYLGEFATGLGRHRRWHAAYRDISLEREARTDAERWLQRQRDRRPL